jgi:hypothetical protein
VGHWWQCISYGTGPAGTDTRWRCRRCRSEEEHWKEPESEMKVRRPDAYDPKLNLSFEETERLYMCEELIVMVVHDI